MMPTGLAWFIAILGMICAVIGIISMWELIIFRIRVLRHQKKEYNPNNNTYNQKKLANYANKGYFTEKNEHESKYDKTCTDYSECLKVIGHILSIIKRLATKCK